MIEARVLFYLDLWQSFMKTNKNNLGYPSAAAGFLTGGISSFEDLADESDSQSARVVDSVIDDLPTNQKEAIYFAYLGQNTKLDDRVIKAYHDKAIDTLCRKLSEKNLY